MFQRMSKIIRSQALEAVARGLIIDQVNSKLTLSNIVTPFKTQFL